MRKFAPKALFLTLSAFLVFTLVTRQVFAAPVNSINMQGWSFLAQSSDGSGTFVVGPLNPPLGTGSARLYTGTHGNLSTTLHNVSYEGTPLANITNLDYSTYSVSVAAGSKFPILLIDVNIIGTGADELTFNPQSQTQTPQLSTWQTWDADKGFWTSESFPNSFTGGSLQDYVAFLAANSLQPASVQNRGDGTGGIRIQAGPGGSGEVFDENVDKFTINTGSGDVVYDFDPDVAVPTPVPGPTNKDECKNNGWKAFSNPAFKNQGECIKSVK